MTALELYNKLKADEAVQAFVNNAIFRLFRERDRKYLDAWKELAKSVAARNPQLAMKEAENAAQNFFRGRLYEEAVSRIAQLPGAKTRLTTLAYQRMADDEGEVLKGYAAFADKLFAENRPFFDLLEWDRDNAGEAIMSAFAKEYRLLRSRGGSGPRSVS